MSILDKEIVDGMALDEDEKALRLLVADHLDWSNEYEHLLLLQGKINNYIAFCEERQYSHIYSDVSVEYVIVEIHFKYEPTANAMKFLSQVQQQVNEIGMTIECHISEE